MRAKKGTLTAARAAFEQALSTSADEGPRAWAERIDPAAGVVEEAIRRQQTELDRAVEGVAGDLAFAPGTDRRLNQLHDDLVGLLGATASLRSQLRRLLDRGSTEAPGGLDGLRQEAEALLGLLKRYEREETALILETVSLDIGAGD